MNSSICAFDSSCSLGSDTIQGICPDGWHIPSKKEAEKLISLASKLSDPLMSKKRLGYRARDRYIRTILCG